MIHRLLPSALVYYDAMFLLSGIPSPPESVWFFSLSAKFPLGGECVILSVMMKVLPMLFLIQDSFDWLINGSDGMIIVIIEGSDSTMDVVFGKNNSWWTKIAGKSWRAAVEIVKIRWGPQEKLRPENWKQNDTPSASLVLFVCSPSIQIMHFMIQCKWFDMHVCVIHLK